jgi:uncharacterized protein (DUF1330 family)
MAKGYVIITEQITDPEGFKEYAKLAAATMGDAKILSFGPPAEVIEGQWHGSQTVMLEFDSVEAAKEWYYSDAYQAAAKVRQAAADCNGIIIAGLG